MDGRSNTENCPVGNSYEKPIGPDWRWNRILDQTQLPPVLSCHVGSDMVVWPERASPSICQTGNGLRKETARNGFAFAGRRFQRTRSRFETNVAVGSGEWSIAHIPSTVTFVLRAPLGRPAGEHFAARWLSTVRVVTWWSEKKDYHSFCTNGKTQKKNPLITAGLKALRKSDGWSTAITERKYPESLMAKIRWQPATNHQDVATKISVWI